MLSLLRKIKIQGSFVRSHRKLVTKWRRKSEFPMRQSWYLQPKILNLEQKLKRGLRSQLIFLCPVLNRKEVQVPLGADWRGFFFFLLLKQNCTRLQFLSWKIIFNRVKEFCQLKKVFSYFQVSVIAPIFSSPNKWKYSIASSYCTSPQAYDCLFQLENL